ncbi:MAG TPA: hypothetical protein VFJ16_23500 [Longimicrobium sp.]|nr:hypothetical protein [Longimicrobium sp.]
MFAGIWAHEGFGVANNSGHEAQGRIAAANPLNDPHTAAEGFYNKDEATVRTLIENEVWQKDVAISNFSAQHTYVKNNWCGSVWLWDLTANAYAFTPIIANGGCL